MKKDLPKIFKKPIDESHSNNKKMCYTSETKQKEESISSFRNTTLDSSMTTVEEKIRKLLKSSRYIFNIGVIIKTDKKNYDTKIAGKIKNSLVTVDNDVIPIVEINDIIIKDRI